MRIAVPAALAVLLLAGAAAPVRAVDVWTPATGEVRLEETPLDSAEARRKHALALIGAGQWGGGVADLRAMMAEDPAADWIPQARVTIARGYLANGRPAEAFDELQPLAIQGPGSPQAEEARRLQFTAARVQVAQDMDKGVELFERLIDSALTWEDPVETHKAEADALFEGGHFMEALDVYSTIILDLPANEWEPYCWFKVAECEWEMAVLLGRRQEDLFKAEKKLLAFVDDFPTDPRVPVARAKLKESRELRAQATWRTARFYIDTAGRPWAALAYMDQIVQEFGGLPEAEKAADELRRMRDAGLVPGQPRVMQMPGAGWKEGER